MLLFNRFDKKSESPPVKITVKSLYFFRYLLTIPSIYIEIPLITPEWIYSFEELPINFFGAFLFNNGKLAVKLFKDL